MKFSGNAPTSMFIFLVLATIVFILMVLRPPVERTAMNLGVPILSEAVATDAVESSSTEQAPANNRINQTGEESNSEGNETVATENLERTSEEKIIEDKSESTTETDVSSENDSTPATN